MTDHMNLVRGGDARAAYENDLNRMAAVPVEWHGPNTGAPKLPASQEYCDRLATAAMERGRPLTPDEITMVGAGKTLPPVAKKVPAEDRIALLEARVAELEKKTPVHLRGVEKRG